MEELSTIIQYLQELEQMHKLNLELLEQFGVFYEWICAQNFPIPDRDKFDSLLHKTKALMNELYFSEPKVLQYKSSRRIFTDKPDRRRLYRIGL